MKTVLVTGATGFIGRNVVDLLISQGYAVHAVIRPGSTNKSCLPVSSHLTITELPMENYNRLGEVASGSCDCYLSFAWDGTRVDDRNNATIQERNLINSIAGLKSVIASGCKTVVTGGSQAEYGICDGLVDENMYCSPNTQYGIRKLEYYNYTNEFCANHSVRLIEPRFFSIYGFGDFEGTFIISILKKMLRNEDCLLTECKQIWNFMHINDASTAIVSLIENMNVAGIYNIASNDTRLLKGFVEEMYKITSSKSNVVYGAIPYPRTGIVSINPDVTKLYDIMGGGMRLPSTMALLSLFKSCKHRNVKLSCNFGIKPPISVRLNLFSFLKILNQVCCTYLPMRMYSTLYSWYSYNELMHRIKNIEIVRV